MKEALSHRHAIPLVPILAVLLLTTTASVGYTALRPDISPPPDAVTTYDPIAISLLEGRGFIDREGNPDFVVGPGYPFFLYIIYSIFGKSFLAVRFVQGIMLGLNAVLVMFLCWRILKRWDRAILSGFIFGMHPILIYASSLILSDMLFVFLFSLFFLLLVYAIQKEKTGVFVLAGLTLGIATLTRSTAIAFPACIGIWVILFKRTKKSVLNFIIFCCTVSVVILPWTIRNYVVFGEIIPTVANSGTNFLSGSSIRYLGPEKQLRAEREADTEKYTKSGLVAKTGYLPGQGDKYLWRLGWQNYKIAFKDNPLSVVQLMLYKSARFWYATCSGGSEKAIILIQSPFLILSIAGLVLLVIRRSYLPEIWLCVFSVSYFWALFTVMFPLARFSVPTFAFLAILASGIKR